MSHALGPTWRNGTALGLVIALATSACGGDPKNVTPPPTTGLSVAKAAPSGDGQFATVQTALASPIQVVVLMDGAPEAGRTVAWTGSGTNPGFNPVSSTTDANGIAQTMWTLPQESGTPTAQATVTGAAGSPVTFSATGVPGAPANLLLVSGSGQAGGKGLPADDPLVVRVVDQFGNGVSNVDVTWVVTQGFATVPTVSQSGTTGEASAAVLYGSVTGPITVTATAAGLGTVQFQLLAGHLITVQNNQFVPSQLNIAAVDGYVVWKWTPDARNHNVVPDLVQPTSSGNPADGPNTYVFNFSVPGNYAFYCIVHGGPGGTGMSGLVSVN